MKEAILQNFNPQTCISGKAMRINRMVANIFRKHIKDYDITDSQLSLLFVMSKKKSMKQSELSKIAILEKSTLNRNLKRLIEKKFLTRDNFPQIEITETGIDFVISIIPSWEKAMSEIREKLGKDGEQSLSLVFNKLKEN